MARQDPDTTLTDSSTFDDAAAAAYVQDRGLNNPHIERNATYISVVWFPSATVRQSIDFPIGNAATGLSFGSQLTLLHLVAAINFGGDPTTVRHLQPAAAPSLAAQTARTTILTSGAKSTKSLK
jgi:hypothetical protein